MGTFISSIQWHLLILSDHPLQYQFFYDNRHKGEEGFDWAPEEAVVRARPYLPCVRFFDVPSGPHLIIARLTWPTSRPRGYFIKYPSAIFKSEQCIRSYFKVPRSPRNMY